MPAGLKGWERAGGGAGVGEIPASYQAVFMERWEEASLADTAMSGSGWSLDASTTQRVKRPDMGGSTRAAGEPETESSRCCHGGRAGGRPSYPDSQTHAPVCGTPLQQALRGRRGKGCVGQPNFSSRISKPSLKNSPSQIQLFPP